ncbi:MULTISPECIES: metallophosphoesterase family protein [Blastomonas]|uniref:metallophosphoesterase family protein n=1 Tax=Blastomonas TaxID=150203 RepID=UPI00083D4A5B|nr:MULTISPECIES: metallophosphoesterase [Blastomonas]AOG01513.1 calcineurin-like phosphoesterase family protein [Blastomonas sp. RAC04]MDK2757967.1 metallophosphoesterase [Blastomonas fulva]
MTLLFHASDLHFGAEDSAALDWFTRCVEEDAPEAVVITGDLTMRARSREFAAAQSWLTALGVPVLIEPGNHDLPYFNPVRRIWRPYGRVMRLQEQLHDGVSIDHVHLVSLPTTARAQWRLNWSKGKVGSRALHNAVQSLEAGPDDTCRIVLTHHPLIEAATRTSGRTTGGRAALEAIAAAGAHAVLSGHVHDPFDQRVTTAYGPVRLIGAGTLSERVRTSRPSFNRITVEGGSLSATVCTMN